MGEAALNIYNWIFNVLILTAFICGLYSLIMGLKKRDSEILLLSFYFFASAATSFTTIFISIETSIILVSFFMFFDFIVFSKLLLKNKPFKQKLILNIFILFLAIALICAVQVNYLNYQTKSLFFVKYALILGGISVTYFFNFIKIYDTRPTNDSFYFWVVSACFFYNLSAFPNELLIFTSFPKASPLMQGISQFLFSFCWIIKYLLLLKAVICKLSIK